MLNEATRLGLSLGLLPVGSTAMGMRELGGLKWSTMNGSKNWLWDVHE